MNAQTEGKVLATILYDLARAAPFVPFQIFFGTGQRYDIKTKEHISLGPFGRSDVEKMKAVIVWDDTGQHRSLYMPAIVRVERRMPDGAREDD